VFSRFFINRPIFASVLSIIVTLAGFVAYRALPVAQYPEIAPPTVEVSAIYPGANAQVVADTVAAPIEQQVNGVEGMMYMSSQCTNDGTYNLTVTFQHGVDLNIAQVLVQNRVDLAQPILPDLVKRNGVTVKKKSTSVLMIINLYSPDNSRPDLYLSNYATIQLKDELSRLKGVGDITYLGRRDYSMRIWIDPDKLAARNLGTADVVTAVEQQNNQVAAGQVGQPPIPSGQVFQLTMSTMGRLVDPDQFGDIILKNDDQGRLIRLKDVARVQLGAESYDQTCTLDGRPSVALSVYQLPGSNALDVAGAVRAKMEELRRRFPSGLDYDIVYDTTPFINESIKEVRKTLIDAIILVAVVVLVFLQNWRTALIPLVAVPVAVMGTFPVMVLLGFSLNNLTLFGLVLAIGIVVDDAIVVVEAVERQMEHGLPPKEATMEAMRLVSGPVVAVGLVLSAVFIPCAFISGITGQFFRQFALTIAVSTALSAFNSLTLSPALSALLLRPQKKGGVVRPLPRLAFALLGGWVGYAHLGPLLTPWVARWLPLAPQALAAPLQGAVEETALVTGIVAAVVVGWLAGRPLNWLLGWLFWGFNVGFDYSTGLYARLVAVMLRGSVLVLAVYGGLLFLTWWGFTRTPTGFIPQQDKGYLLVNVQLPDSASLQRTDRVMHDLEKAARAVPGVSHAIAIGGQSVLLNANAPNFGSMFVMLDEFERRLGPGLSGDAIAARLQADLQDGIREGVVRVFGAPPVEGLGTAGGFKFVIQDRSSGDSDLKNLQENTDQVVDSGNEDPGLEGLYTSFRARTPWLYLKINRTMAKKGGVSIAEIFNTLQVDVGSLYVNDFNQFGRTWKVTAQASDEYRRHAGDLKHLRIRNDKGKMVPFGTMAEVEERFGPVMMVRYNMYPAAIINGSPRPGVSSGQAIKRMEEVARRELGPSMHPEWTELAFLQLQTGDTATKAFVLAVVLVFLVLAAQYESWSLPLAVILVLPMCLLFSVIGVALADMDINIFTQVGFIVLVGLACKNAILIVEYAKAQREADVPTYEATLAACRLRLRPIMMTSFAFILGVVPLMLSEGAGAEMRRTLGTAVFSGMLGVTLFGIFLTPVFYYVIQWVKDRRTRPAPAVAIPAPSPDGNGVAGNGHPHGERPAAAREEVTARPAAGE
jgi:multidrug efflux pump subunit AcrB